MEPGPGHAGHGDAGLGVWLGLLARALTGMSAIWPAVGGVSPARSPSRAPQAGSGASARSGGDRSIAGSPHAAGVMPRRWCAAAGRSWRNCSTSGKPDGGVGPAPAGRRAGRPAHRPGPGLLPHLPALQQLLTSPAMRARRRTRAGTDVRDTASHCEVIAYLRARGDHPHLEPGRRGPAGTRHRDCQDRHREDKLRLAAKP
jgi:hypothetical protein